MSRTQLKIAAVVLVLAIVVVGANAFDRLPSNLRAQIDSERAALKSAQSQLGAIRTQVSDQVQTSPDVFNALPFGRQWSDRMGKASGDLRTAANDVDLLTALEKHNRRSDRQQAETLLADEKKNRTQAVTDATGIQKESARWVDASQHVPDQVPAMERAYQTIRNFDLNGVTATVQKAENDWPEKKSDLDARLTAERNLVTAADGQWQSTAALREKATAGKLSGAEIGTLLASEDTLQTAANDLTRNAGELKTLSGQLYVSWDKLLVDMQKHSDQYEQKIRTVRTHLANATTKSGDVSNDEQWTPVPSATYDAMRNDLGMAIEHKPAGKYDYEADHVVQPAGLAYVAPYSQGSNQYGYWDHRDGRDFWVFYGQYALLRDLLFNHDYRPFDRYEFEEYRTYSMRGQTYYGRDATNNIPKYGTQGVNTQRSYSSSSYAKGGGFRDSQYASKSGSYRNSQYASPTMKDPNADHSPKTFGHSPAGNAPPARTFRPAPAPSAPRSAPRSFGRRR